MDSNRMGYREKEVERLIDLITDYEYMIEDAKREIAELEKEEEEEFNSEP